LNGPNDRRAQSNALYFANPRAENIYQVQPGDNLDRILRKTGLTKDHLQLLNQRDESKVNKQDQSYKGRPYVADWGKLNAGQRIFIGDPKYWLRGPVR